MRKGRSGSTAAISRPYRSPTCAAGIAYVTQDTFLFSGTIRDNILFGRPDASEGKVVEAARAANALPFIETFPEGFDTDIGENGGGCQSASVSASPSRGR